LNLAAAAALFASLGGCTARIGPESFFPPSLPAPQASLAALPGYRMTDAMLELPGLGTVHAVRLDHPASETTIIYSGGNGSFVSALSPIAAALADATGADLILYDYPGRGGTNIPPTIDAAIATGPALVAELRQRGWIGRGGVFAYGLSFGGSQAAAMARDGGFDGLILEGAAADVVAVGRNFVPGLARPFVRLRVDPELSRFDFLGYAVAARAPILLVVAEQDTVVRPRNMAAFADQLRARGTEVSTVSVRGTHGTALRQAEARAAIGAFVTRHARR
jgi:dienelactone hydrolase